MISTVAVGTDGSDTAGKAVEAAAELADKFGAKLVVISAYEPKSDSRINRESRDAPKDVQWQNHPREEVEGVLEEAGKVAGSKGVTCELESAEGDAADAIVAVAARHEADVIVVGNKGMHRKILGSVPNDVAHIADCDVWIVNTT
jgi:nucleotide-binding universal stress UspA family protein